MMGREDVRCFWSRSWVLAVIGGSVVDWIGRLVALGEVVVVVVSYLDFIIFIFLGICSFEIIGNLDWGGAGWVMVDVSSNFEGGRIAAT